LDGHRRSKAGSVELNDFGGVAGRTLVLPADGQVRVFLVRKE